MKDEISKEIFINLSLLLFVYRKKIKKYGLFMGVLRGPCPRLKPLNPLNTASFAMYRGWYISVTQHNDKKSLEGYDIDS